MTERFLELLYHPWNKDNKKKPEAAGMDHCKQLLRLSTIQLIVRKARTKQAKEGLHMLMQLIPHLTGVTTKTEEYLQTCSPSEKERFFRGFENNFNHVREGKGTKLQFEQHSEEARAVVQKKLEELKRIHLHA